MKQYSTFLFDSCTFDPQSGEVRLHYMLEDEVSFTEILEIPMDESTTLSPLSSKAQAALFALHLAGGTSYFKTCCPKKIEVQSGKLDADQAAFWNTVYERGLGEFFYQNQIDFRGLINFPIADHRSPITPLSKPRTKNQELRTLVPIGGGKDSIVTIEKLKAEGKDITLLRMGAHPLIDGIVAITNLPCITVQRKLPRKLFEMNEQGALNGHVPITAYLSCLCVFLAQLLGFDEIAMSNEKSANIGNVEYLGQEINHQWSKSEEFEQAFANYVRTYIDPNLLYYSALREKTELEIVGEFVKYPQYFACTTSCNKNWKILQKTESGRWCGHCPKCAFVFALMAAYLPKQDVVGMFGKNIFDDPSTLPLYRQLLGFEGCKPFECVGTPQETRQAFEMIRKKGDFNDTAVMKELKIED